MKKIAAFVLLIWTVLSAKGQDVQVTYQYVVTMTMQLTTNGVMSNKTASVTSRDVRLTHRNGKSIYETLTEAKTEVLYDMSWLKMDMEMESPSVYKDFDRNEIISEESILDKPFLVSGTMTDYQWSIDSAETVIAGMKCSKATGRDAAGEITAWFCPEIPVGDGPYVYTGLPGVILKTEVQNVVITATDVQFFNDSGGITIQKPDRGKKIKRVAFEKLKARKMKQIGDKGMLDVNVRVN